MEYVPTPEELAETKNYVAMLDPQGAGITANRLRIFYPGVGWNVIYARLYALVDAGELTRRFAGQPVPFEYFSVAAAE